MAYRASRRCVSTVVIIVVIVAAAAALSTAAATSLFTPLHGSFEESVGVSSCRRVVAGRGADLFRGVDSFPGEGVVFAALQFLLE